MYVGSTNQIFTSDEDFSSRLTKLDFDFISSLFLELISSNFVPVKILANGDIKKAYNVTASSFSKSAIEKIEKAGGKVIVE